MLPLPLQVLQAPVQAVLQQTPATQLPDSHWSAAAQADPLVLRGRHWPALQ